MATSRTRSKFTPARLGRVWSDPIPLGWFRQKLSGTNNGIPWEEWAGYHESEISYNPDVSLVEGKITTDELHSGPPFKTGGPFKSITVSTGLPLGGVYGKGVYTNASGMRRYEGGFGPPANWAWEVGWAQTPLAGLSINSTHFPSMAPWVDLGWARTKPKLEKASAFVFIAEAKDLPRMLKTTSDGFHQVWKSIKGDPVSPMMQPKAAANHFLNHQFGWKPFLNDISGFNQTYQNTARLLGKTTRDNGKFVRRRVNLSDGQPVTTVLGQSNLTPNGISYAIPLLPFSFPADYFTHPPHWSVQETTQSNVSAVGKFRYYRPEFDDSLPDYSSAWNSAMRYMTLYGLRVNPSNIYKAIPWSWALDWISNAGDYVDQLTDIWSDSIAAEYFYVMHHLRVTRTLTITLPFVSGGVTFVFHRYYDCKQRLEASGPYGFSLSWDNLSPRQLAIAGALGISRM